MRSSNRVTGLPVSRFAPTSWLIRATGVGFGRPRRPVAGVHTYYRGNRSARSHVPIRKRGVGAGSRPHRHGSFILPGDPCSIVLEGRRPDARVRAVAQRELDWEAARHGPCMVVCDRVTPMGRAAHSRVHVLPPEDVTRWSARACGTFQGSKTSGSTIWCRSSMRLDAGPRVPSFASLR